MVSQDKESTSKRLLTSVMEDYMEAIFNINRTKKVVRVKDIAHEMNVKMPTVSSMLKTLKSKGLIHYEKYEYIELTKKGEAVGGEIRRKHKALLRFLLEILKVKPEKANEEACKMEHALGSGTLDALIDFMEFIQACPRAGESWLGAFDNYRQKGGVPENCQIRCEDYSAGLSHITAGGPEPV